VDFAGGEIRLDAATTKNEHERLKKAGHICPFVFFREVAEGRGGEIKPHRIISFTKARKSACRKAGCPGRIPHDLRRTAIRNLVRAGVPERVAMRMTGHKTASMFQRYNIVSDGDLREAARKLDAVSNAKTAVHS
jgi:integrase